MHTHTHTHILSSITLEKAENTEETTPAIILNIIDELSLPRIS